MCILQAVLRSRQGNHKHQKLMSVLKKLLFCDFDNRLLFSRKVHLIGLHFQGTQKMALPLLFR